MSNVEWNEQLYTDVLKDYHKEVAPTHEGAVQLNLHFTIVSLDFIVRF